ncbi:MAG: glycoside hydrolase family 127 protein [Rubellimicrobium sp.]|nr:glycoside hydrolase family 127 protein [Rubellimicrobium sp.]
MSSPRNQSFRPPSIADVDLGGFWGDRIDAVANKTVRILYDRCVAAGMLDQVDPSRPVPDLRIPFMVKDGFTAGTVTTQMFWDSDIAKTIEATAYAVYRKRDPELEALIDAVIDMYARLQQPDGYCNSWYVRMQPGRRWTNLRDCHELYCAGHMIEAAVAYAQATGKRKLLDVMCRYVDHIATVFGPGEGQLPGYCGHEEIELALVRLSRETGRQDYMDLAKFFIDARGTQPHYFDEEAHRDGRNPKDFHFRTYEYNQSHLPVREQRTVVGHAVRAMYLYSGMADIAAEYGDDTLTDALEILWDDLTGRQMYLTGGIGPAASNEGFTAAYDLPNDTAYAETCASVGLAFWAARMLGRGPDRRFADTMERAIYNGALAGLSQDGSTFFYENPLESRGGHHRWEWHHCPCCPPNIARMVGAIGTYMYGVADTAVAVHLYGESTARMTVAGAALTLTQAGDYPWAETVTLTIGLDRPATFTLHLRVPDWAGKAGLKVNGTDVPADPAGNTGYIALTRDWADGDSVALHLPMQARLIHPHPRIRADTGRVAVMRGPLVYCAEGADNGADLDLMTMAAVDGATTARVPELGGAVALDLPVALETDAAWGKSIYTTTPPKAETAVRRFIPYHLWDNRDPGEMLVWVRRAGGA